MLPLSAGLSKKRTLPRTVNAPSGTIMCEQRPVPKEHDARQFIYKPTELSVSVIPMLVEMIVRGSKHGDATADLDTNGSRGSK